MPINPRYSRLIAGSLSGVLLLQARSARRGIPDLPAAALPWTGAIAGDEPLNLLVLGDSTAAGVGTDNQEDALPGNLARAFAAEWNRGVTWRAIGENGATTRDIVERFLDDASRERYDVIFLTIGANDALGMRSRRAFTRDYRTILRRLRAVSPDALVLVPCFPAFSEFASIPNPLRWALALHASNLESAAHALIRLEPGMIMAPPAPPYGGDFFATDRFHPSANGYRDWVDYTLRDARLLSEL
jgi:lysophospholipase L1-like esterase